MDDLLEAVDRIADTSFDANPPKTFGANKIAKRRSESEREGFYRPGERPKDGEPFTPTTTIPKYTGPPSGRAPTVGEKRAVWPLQDEYLQGRLGKNEEENSRLWDTAKWIDRLHRIATMPAGAVKTLNLCTDNFYDVIPDDRWRGSSGESDPEDDHDGFAGVEVVNIDERDKARLALKLSDYDLVRLWDYFKECDQSAKVDIDKLVGQADPLPDRIDLPGPIERQEAIKILRMLMLGMGSLWRPVIQAIANHATMSSLGKAQGSGVAATIGRTRIIEGLRLAVSIRKRLKRKEFISQRELEPSYTVATCLDKLIVDVLTQIGGQTFGDCRASWLPFRDWRDGSYVHTDGRNRSSPNQLADNDNCDIDAVASNAA